jgi:hypothetical protein
MPNDGPLIFTYDHTTDVLRVGDSSDASVVTTGHNNFSLEVDQISTAATFAGLYYTVSSPANATPCLFKSGMGTFTVGPPWTHVPFPMIGLRLAQTIRVNGPVPVPGPGPCEALLNIYDAANNLVASQSVSSPGSVAFDYSLRSAIGATSRLSGRKELRPEVILMPNAAGAAACQAQAMAEVYDDLTKSTSLIVPETSPRAVGLPAVQLGPIGVGFLQTVRLNVVAYPPSPCFGTLSFTDTHGNLIGTPSTVSLTGGQAGFVDLPGTAVPSDSGHGEVMAVFAQTPQTPGVPPGACLPSAEVYDQLTGGTQVIVSPGPSQ